jgi:hypothetical protein
MEIKEVKISDAQIDEWFPGYLKVFSRQDVLKLVDSVKNQVNISPQQIDPKKRKN